MGDAFLGEGGEEGEGLGGLVVEVVVSNGL